MVTLVYGVGVNDSPHQTQRYNKHRKLVWSCPYYAKWKSMLARCYSERYKESVPTYCDVKCSEEWLTFSVFMRDMIEYEQRFGVSVKNTQLDKDILFEGCKVYSRDTCVLVTKRLNIFLTDRRNDRGTCALGVTYMKGETFAKSPYRAQCSDPFTGKRKSKCFSRESDASNQWREWKLEFLEKYILIGEIKDDRIIHALRLRYS